MKKLLKSLILLLVTISLVMCNTAKPKEEKIESTKIETTTIEPNNDLVKEFNNFKNKSNYIEDIEAYDLENPPEILGGKGNAENIRYYDIPTKINVKQYGNNEVIFGDLNNDNKRDCIISVFRADHYNEVLFFYIFINQGNKYTLEDVTNENKICGCKDSMWPNLFREQKIEGGLLKGVTTCHYNDAHCCPSLYFKTEVKYDNGKLRFHSAEFIEDSAQEYRDTPDIKTIITEPKRIKPTIFIIPNN